jgi:hypothetical protein
MTSLRAVHAQVGDLHGGPVLSNEVLKVGGTGKH